MSANKQEACLPKVKTLETEVNSNVTPSFGTPRRHLTVTFASAQKIDTKNDQIKDEEALYKVCQDLAKLEKQDSESGTFSDYQRVTLNARTGFDIT